MPATPSTFEIRVLRRASNESWTDEALVIVDGRDQLAMLGRNDSGRDRFGAGTLWIGRSPETVVGATSPLLPSAEPHDAYVARCSCGQEGCGALIARIRREGDHVIWDQIRHGSDARADEVPVDFDGFVFDAMQYEDAVLGRMGPVSSWHPTTRRAASLARRRLKGWRDPTRRLRLSGIEERGDEQLRVSILLGRSGDRDYSILDRTFTLDPDDFAEELAGRVVDYVTSGAILDDDLAARRPIP